jgi:hypothetical protein
MPRTVYEVLGVSKSNADARGMMLDAFGEQDFKLFDSAGETIEYWYLLGWWGWLYGCGLNSGAKKEEHQEVYEMGVADAADYYDEDE